MPERTGKVRGKEVEFSRCPMCGAETTDPYLTGGETNICPPEEVGGCGARFRVFLVSAPQVTSEAE